MAFFPPTPSDGDQANVGNIIYQWSTALGAWNRVGTTVVQLVDGQNVTLSGNLQVNGLGTSLFTTNITTSKAITASLNISSSGNVVGSNLVTNGGLYVTGNTETGALSVTGVATSGSLNTGLITATGVSSSGSIQSSGNVNAINTVTASTLSSTGNITVNGNIVGGGSVGVPGNISGGNLISLSEIQSIGAISTAGNVVAAGNVSGQYVFGNAYFMTGISAGGGSGLGTRSNVTITTGSIANGVTVETSFTAYKGYALYKIFTSQGAWVRVYTSQAARTTDASRSIFNDPQPGSGVVAEVVTLNPNETTLMSPATIGWNNEATPSNVIPVSITNISGDSANIEVIFTVLQLEV
jgi:hypothetical protein